MTQSNLKKFFYSVLIGMGIVLLIGGRGIMNIRRINAENTRIVRNIAKLKIENQKYEKEIELLRGNSIYQEKVVRELLDFSKKGEIVYIFDK